TFMVTYTPTLAGAFSFDIDIVSDDADENPYDIAVSGTATGDPEIDVSSSLNGAIADGGTDAQGAQIAGAAVTLTYTINNTGTDTLNITGTPTTANLTNITGAVTVTAPTSNAIAPGGSAMFDVTYTPTIAGAFSFDIDIVNDDADENPYDILVSGTATGFPEIDVSSSASGAVADGGTDAQGAQIAGAPVTVTYTINNTGTDTLNITGTPTTANGVNVGMPVVTAPTSNAIAPGGNATFMVTYTPTLAGAFSFEIDIVNDDGDENPYDILVSGNATGMPEIDVSSSISGPVADGGTDAQGTPNAGTPVTITYTITNTGTDTLNITGTPTTANLVNVNAPVTVTAPTSNAIAPGGNATFMVTYTPTMQGAFSFDIDIVNDDADENPYDIAVTGTAPDVTAPTVDIQGAPGSHDSATPFTVTIQFSEDVQNFVLGDVTVVGGAPSNLVMVNASTFTVDITPAGTDDLTIDVAGGVATDLAGNPNDPAPQITVLGTIIEQTQTAIADFLLNRANLILSNQPDLIEQFQGNTGGGGEFGALQLNANEASQTFSFSTSRSKILSGFDRQQTELLTGQSVDPLAVLQAPSSSSSPAGPATVPVGEEANLHNRLADEASSSHALAFGGNEDDASDNRGIRSVLRSLGTNSRDDTQGADAVTDDGVAPSRAGTWDVWLEIYGSRSTSDTSESSLGVGYVGAHYFVDDYTLVGLLGQIDWADESNSATNSSADGVGWMVGPYIAGQVPGEPLYYEARVAYGQSDNDISPLGTFTDAFETTRFLASGRVSGSFVYSDYTISPEARVSYFEETQESYTDSLNNVIPEQTISLGEVRFGPEVSRTFTLEDGMQLETAIGASGVFNFAVDDNNASQGFGLGNEDFRARLDGGFALIGPDGMQFTITGFYDGLGISDFESYGGSVRVVVPFN
ncbi:MAG: DUF1573 domain-containing protein, partial [Pseudomonadota bacterium]